VKNGKEMNVKIARQASSPAPQQPKELHRSLMKSLKYCLALLIVTQVTAAPAFSQTPPEKNPSEKTSFLKRATVSENAGTTEVTANSPRPLAQALDALQQKYGWLAGYEDPQFRSKSDLAEPATAGGQILPAGGRFTAEFPSTVSDEEKILQTVVDAYNSSENPGRFELRKTKQGGFSIVGTQSKNAQGHITPQRPALDAPITLLPRQRTATDTINLIARRIAEQRGVKITLGVSPRNLLDHNNVKVSGTKVPARELILQVLSSLRGSFYWRLLFDPNSKGYFLDIHLEPSHPK
jgi:hypothetical protein